MLNGCWRKVQTIQFRSNMFQHGWKRGKTVSTSLFNKIERILKQMGQATLSLLNEPHTRQGWNFCNLQRKRKSIKQEATGSLHFVRRIFSRFPFKLTIFHCFLLCHYALLNIQFNSLA